MSLPPLFDGKVFKTNGCWFWLGATAHGYGRLWDNGRRWGAHVLAWVIANKTPVPAGKEIMHSCDIKNCVNPAHLSIGTRSENMRDLVAKGGGLIRSPRGPHTHCKWGHAFTPENTRIEKNGQQRCVACKRLKDERRSAAHVRRAAERRERERGEVPK